jgi:hypothetical protein
MFLLTILFILKSKDEILSPLRLPISPHPRAAWIIPAGVLETKGRTDAVSTPWRDLPARRFMFGQSKPEESSRTTGEAVRCGLASFRRHKNRPNGWACSGL